MLKVTRRWFVLTILFIIGACAKPNSFPWWWIGHEQKHNSTSRPNCKQCAVCSESPGPTLISLFASNIYSRERDAIIECGTDVGSLTGWMVRSLQLTYILFLSFYSATTALEQQYGQPARWTHWMFISCHDPHRRSMGDWYNLTNSSNKCRTRWPIPPS